MNTRTAYYHARRLLRRARAADCLWQRYPVAWQAMHTSIDGVLLDLIYRHGRGRSVAAAMLTAGVDCTSRLRHADRWRRLHQPAAAPPSGGRHVRPSTCFGGR